MAQVTETTTSAHIGRREITVEIRDHEFNGHRSVTVWTPDTKKWAQGVASMHCAWEQTDGSFRFVNHAPKFAHQVVAAYTARTVHPS